jgi:hypothetical protein
MVFLIGYLFDSLGPNLFISSRIPIIANGNKIAAIALVIVGLTISIICRAPYYSLLFSQQIIIDNYHNRK